jgi:hypothetical protein
MAATNQRSPLRRANSASSPISDGGSTIVSSQTLAEDDGRVVGVSREHARERERRVERGPRFHPPVLEAEDTLAGHLVRPGARLARGLVRPVEVDHQLEFRGVLQDRLIEYR